MLHSPCNELYWSALHYTPLLCTTMHCTEVNWSELQHSAIHFISVHCTQLTYAALYCKTLHCTAIQYTTLHCTRTLHCTASTKPSSCIAPLQPDPGGWYCQSSWYKTPIQYTIICRRNAECCNNKLHLGIEVAMNYRAINFIMGCLFLYDRQCIVSACHNSYMSVL